MAKVPTYIDIPTRGDFKGNAMMYLPTVPDGRSFGFGRTKAKYPLDHFLRLEEVSPGDAYSIEIGGQYPKTWVLKPAQVDAAVRYVHDIEKFVDDVEYEFQQKRR